MRYYVVIAILLLCIFLFGCFEAEKANPQKEKYCNTNSDCACGVHKKTGNCFFGNKDFVDISRTCPDFCTGIAGNFNIICFNSTCTQERSICKQHLIEDCPKQCVICPPCETCSSISCQTEAFCAGMGFDKDWYEKNGG